MVTCRPAARATDDRRAHDAGDVVVRYAGKVKTDDILEQELDGVRPRRAKRWAALHLQQEATRQLAARTGKAPVDRADERARAHIRLSYAAVVEITDESQEGGDFVIRRQWVPGHAVLKSTRREARHFRSLAHQPDQEMKVADAWV
jgi:hypothetical protein